MLLRGPPRAAPPSPARCPVAARPCRPPALPRRRPPTLGGVSFPAASAGAAGEAAAPVPAPAPAKARWGGLARRVGSGVALAGGAAAVVASGGWPLAVLGCLIVHQCSQVRQEGGGRARAELAGEKQPATSEERERVVPLPRGPHAHDDTVDECREGEGGPGGGAGGRGARASACVCFLFSADGRPARPPHPPTPTPSPPPPFPRSTTASSPPKASPTP